MIQRARRSRAAVALSLLSLLLFLLICFCLWLALLYPKSDPLPSSVSEPLDYSGMARFNVTSSKADLQQVINSYLQTYAHADHLSYQVSLTQELEFVGEVRVLGQNINTTLDFTPALQAGGNIIFKLRAFHVGELPLPGNVLLQYLSHSYAFPQWIHMNPADGTVLLDMAQLNADRRMKIRVTALDLAKDRLSFALYLP